MSAEVPVEKLVEEARRAMANAYCPYSNFPVGAALLTQDGKIISGCNVENASYPVGICAERTAIVKAISEGHRKFKAVAVIAKKTSVSPCGMCRQTLRELGKDLTIHCVQSDGRVVTKTLEQLLPDSFGPENLKT